MLTIIFMDIQDRRKKRTTLSTFKPIKRWLMEAKHAMLTSMADPKDIMAKRSLLTYENNSTSDSQDKQ